MSAPMANSHGRTATLPPGRRVGRSRLLGCTVPACVLARRGRQGTPTWPPDGQLNDGVAQRISVERRVRAAERVRQTPCRVEQDAPWGVPGSVKQVGDLASND